MSEQRAEYQTEKTIFRIEKNADNPFVMMDRRPLEKPYLSWKAKGLLAYLLSRPDNWVINFGDLIKRSTDGEFATRAAAKELIEAGHIKVAVDRDKKGKITKWTYTVYEQPLRENLNVGNQDVGNRNINDTDINEKEVNEREEPAPDFENMTVSQARKIPTLKLYRKATGVFPGDNVWGYVHDFLTKHAITEEKLREAAVIWGARGYNRYNAEGILEWARDGIPDRPRTNGHKRSAPVPVQTETPEELAERRKLAKELMGL